MARKPNYKRMYSDAVNLLKLKKEGLPKEEEVPEDFKQNGIEPLKNYINEVNLQIEYFEKNKGNRLVPPTLQVLASRLLKVISDMDKINSTLVKVEIEDYEVAYNEIMKEILYIDAQLSVGHDDVKGHIGVKGEQGVKGDDIGL